MPPFRTYHEYAEKLIVIWYCKRNKRGLKRDIHSTKTKSLNAWFKSETFRNCKRTFHWIRFDSVHCEFILVYFKGVHCAFYKQTILGELKKKSLYMHECIDDFTNSNGKINFDMKYSTNVCYYYENMHVFPFST